MNSAQLIGLLPAFIGVLGGITVAALTAFFGIRNYRRQKETDRKSTAYERFLKAHADYQRLLGVAGKEEETEKAGVEYSQALVALFPVASDDVVIAVKEFHDFPGPGTQPEQDPNEWISRWKGLYATMVYEMRKDAFIVETALSKDQLAGLLPWYFESGDEMPEGTLAETPNPKMF